VRPLANGSIPHRRWAVTTEMRTLIWAAKGIAATTIAFAIVGAVVTWVRG